MDQASKAMQPAATVTDTAGRLALLPCVPGRRAGQEPDSRRRDSIDAVLLIGAVPLSFCSLRITGIAGHESDAAPQASQDWRYEDHED